jgi:hypothetical protein
MKKDLYLLRSETLLILQATDNVDSFNVIYAVPPNYTDQVPVFFEVRNDTSAEIIDYKIINDIHLPNRLLKFSIAPIEKGKKIVIHFDFWVLVNNKKYNDLPGYIRIPEEMNLPESTKTWLASTNAIQADNMFIKFKARFFKGLNNNLLCLVKKIIIYVSFHRWVLQTLRRYIEMNSYLRPFLLRRQYWTGLMDAISCLFFGGLCCGQANLAAALLRANGVPTKILIVTTFGSVKVSYVGEKKWLDSQHYMIEFYCPDYGWIKCTPGKFGFQPKNYIIFRIIYPEDEDIAGNGLSYYGGMEPWFWISNKNISIIFPEEIISSYKKPRGNVSGVPAIRIWTEKKITIEDSTADSVFNITQNAWELYVRCSNIDLNVTKKQDFEVAVDAQRKAIEHFNQSLVEKYIEYQNIAINKFKIIEI